jgi:hypothetical protein
MAGLARGHFKELFFFPVFLGLEMKNGRNG